MYEKKFEYKTKENERSEKPQIDDIPAKKKLQREIQREALKRLEDAARTAGDFQLVTDWWDKLDANRERKERYHEISRSGDNVPLDYEAAENGLMFPNNLSNMLANQIRRGNFIDIIFNCPYEIHELVTEEYLSRILKNLSESHKEILFLHAIRLYNSKLIGEIRGQSDRNIRKVRNTMFKKIHKKMFPILAARTKNKIPMTKEERLFVADMKKAALDENKDS